MSRYELPKLYEGYDKKTHAEMKSASHVVINLDLWSDEGNAHQVIGVIAHFLRSGRPPHLVLGVVNVKNARNAGQLTGPQPVNGGSFPTIFHLASSYLC